MLAMTPINVFDVLLVDDSLKKTNCGASFHYYHMIPTARQALAYNKMHYSHASPICPRCLLTCTVSVSVRKATSQKECTKMGWGSMAMRLAPTLVLNDGPKLITDVFSLLCFGSHDFEQSFHIYL